MAFSAPYSPAWRILDARGQIQQAWPDGRESDSVVSLRQYLPSHDWMNKYLEIFRAQYRFPGVHRRKSQIFVHYHDQRIS
jgi:hypothetical protein